jgi:hypothetical protein
MYDIHINRVGPEAGVEVGGTSVDVGVGKAASVAATWVATASTVGVAGCGASEQASIARIGATEARRTAFRFTGTSL